jgi:transcription termination factor NusB
MGISEENYTKFRAATLKCFDEMVELSKQYSAEEKKKFILRSLFKFISRYSFRIIRMFFEFKLNNL